MTEAEISELVELAWRDEVSFDDIAAQTGYRERQVIAIMRSTLKPSSFRLWRKRVAGRRVKTPATNPLMTESDPKGFAFFSTRELLAHRAKLIRAGRRRGLPAQALAIRQALEKELERRRMARMDRFSRNAPEFDADKLEDTDRVESRPSQKRITE